LRAGDGRAGNQVNWQALDVGVEDLSRDFLSIAIEAEDGFAAERQPLAADGGVKGQYQAHVRGMTAQGAHGIR
jgi:hypothetical protein